MSVVGIDLGTTNTVVACVRSGKVHVLADERGARLLPSVVSFHPNGEVLVGAAAKARRVIDPRNTVYSHKRLIGRSWGSPEIAQARQRFAFELREGPGQGPLVNARGQDYTLPEISAFVLKRTRQIAETALGAPVERAVITVPAHFNELQRASTKVAGRVSGLEVLRILNEPTAAALAYGLGRKGNERVAVYDFGGGTFDCTLLDLNGNVFEVLATAGDSFLGGDDIDNMIAERMAEMYLKAYRQDLRTDPQLFERLKTTAEDVKIALSTADTHTVVLKELGHGVGGSSINFNFTLSRRELDAMITPLVDKSFKVTQDALALARLTPTAFDKVILVGGSTRAPLIRERVASFFGQAPMDRVNPDEVVAIGAAIQAAALTEGQRKRSIPAPPPVPGKPRTLPGLQNELGETTQTSELTAPPKPAAAFGSGPPAFGFAPQSEVPPRTISGPPGARPAPGRQATQVGVAPANAHTKPTSPPGLDDEPSMASFPDLAVPTPFEWFPSGSPSSGDTATGPAGSERSFGGNTITQTAAPLSPQAPSSAASTNPRGAGFGAIDEPASMVSTPSGSAPSFPSLNVGDGVALPFGDLDDSTQAPFGAVKDLSLVSSGGAASSEPAAGFGHTSDLSLISQNTATAAMDAITQARKRALESGSFDDSDETDAMTRAARPAGGFELKPSVAPSRRDEDFDLPALAGEKADLPAVAKSKIPPKRPGAPGMTATGGSQMLGKPPPAKLVQPFGPMERRDDAPLSRTAAMPARPPPPAPSSVRGGRVPTAPPPPLRPSAPPGPQPAQSPGPMPARSPATAAFGSQPAAFGSQPAANRGAPASAFGTTQGLGAPPLGLSEPFASTPPAAPPAWGRRTEQHGSAPPPPNAYAAPPQAAPFPQTAPLQQQAPFPQTAPLQQQAPFPQTAPLQQQAPFPQTAPLRMHEATPSAPPPPAYRGSAPPQAYAPSAPPFGFPSAPPGMGTEPLGATPLFDGSGGVNPGMAAPPVPQGISYQSPVLVDVTPRGLVVETAGAYTDTIIPRNSKIPCERTRRFATGRDLQSTVRVRVAQGEHPSFPQNTYLGEVELSGLRAAPRGEVVVAVTFEVDADGTLRVRARDVATGQEARATLQLIGVADESSVVMMINRFAKQPVSGGQQ